MEGNMSSDHKTCYATVPKRANSKKRKHVDNFDSVSSFIWYNDYNGIMDSLNLKLEELSESMYRKLEHDIGRFINSCEYSAERIPTIALFTGINLADHSFIFTTITDFIRDHSAVQCRVVDLDPSKATSLKSLIGNTVFNFINNCNNNKTDASIDDDDEMKLIPKSKCTLLRLIDWYNNNINDDSKTTYLIIVVSDIGAFPSRMLNDFIRTLSVFRDRIPLMFLIGVPTTLNVIHKTFSNDVISKLSVHLFQSQPSKIFLDKVLEEVFLTSDCLFQLGPNVYQMLTELFLNYNFSVTEFIKGIKLCVMEHFFQLNLSVTCCDSENFPSRVEELNEDEITRILKLPSVEKYNVKRKMEKKPILTASSSNVKKELKKLRVEFGRSLARFHLAVRCLHSLLKSITENSLSAPMREIYIQIMNSDNRSSWLDKHFNNLNFLSKDILLHALMSVSDLLKTFDHDASISEVYSKLLKHIEIVEKSDLQVIKKNLAKSPVKIDLKLTNRRDFKETLKTNASKDKSLSEFDAAKNDVLDFLRLQFFKVNFKQIDDIPLHELFIFDDHKIVLRLLDGVPRTAIDHALNNPAFYLECDCCKQKCSDNFDDTLPDLSIMYKLHTEHGTQVNLYDWFEQFRFHVDKEDANNANDQEIRADVYARFVHAVRELHFLGFISRPKKKASNDVDFVTKLTL